MKNKIRTVHGSCHCEAVQFEFDLFSSQHDLRRCNCSLCRRKGAIMLAVKIGNFRILRGAEELQLYQWNLKIARHYFCKTCGIYTHHQRRSNPLEIGVNVGCLHNVTPTEFDTNITGNGATL